MQKLTRQEAREILLEAQRLKKLYSDCRPRLGQAIWWCAGNESQLSLELRLKLGEFLEKDSGGEKDVYHWIDDHKIIQKFYELYVEQY